MPFSFVLFIQNPYVRSKTHLLSWSGMTRLISELWSLSGHVYFWCDFGDASPETLTLGRCPWCINHVRILKTKGFSSACEMMRREPATRLNSQTSSLMGFNEMSMPRLSGKTGHGARSRISVICLKITPRWVATLPHDHSSRRETLSSRIWVKSMQRSTKLKRLQIKPASHSSTSTKSGLLSSGLKTSVL